VVALYHSRQEEVKPLLRQEILQVRNEALRMPA